jgi:hypothetical protein
LMVPRSEVVAVWASVRMVVERIHGSIHPQRDRFTSVPPKTLILQL